MAAIHADPAELWNLFSAISDVKEDVSRECENSFRMLDVLQERLNFRKKQIPKEIDSLEHELTMVRNRKKLAEEAGNPTAEMDDMEAAISARISGLEAKLVDIRQCSKKAECYRDLLAADEKKCIASLRSGCRRVNKYIRFLESLLLEEDFQAYQALAGNSVPGDHAGRYRSMSFRGITFYCNEKEADTDRVDGKGRTNLERMEQGLAPVGADGLSVNLHHMQQSETGSIIELTETMHSRNHKPLHPNTNDIPSGINRSTFNVLKSAYWKRRASFIKKSRGM